MTDLADFDEPIDRTAGFDLEAAGAELGASSMQIDYARHRLAGMNRTRAARAAGYAGEGATLRSTASKIEKGRVVQLLLKMADERGAGMPDLPHDRAARKRLLAKLMHGADRNLAIRAMGMLSEIEAEEHAAGLEGPRDLTPTQALAAIAAVSPLFAYLVARPYGLHDAVPLSGQAKAIIDVCFRDLAALNDQGVREVFHPKLNSRAAAEAVDEAA